MSKALACKHEGLSVGPPNPHKGQVQRCTSAGVAGRDRKILRVPWMASLPKPRSNFSERAYLKMSIQATNKKQRLLK